MLWLRPVVVGVLMPAFGIAKSLSLWAVKLDSSLIDRSKGNLDLEEIVEYEGILKES